MSEYKPTEARLRERVKGSLGEYAHEFGIDGEAAMDEWIDQALAERDNRVRSDERAKRPDRAALERIAAECEADIPYDDGNETAKLIGKRIREALALEPEADQELQDRIEVLEKNLAYEVAQKIKLAEQLQAATVTGLTLEQARWKMHAGIESRCSEEVAAEVKPVIDLVFSSLALEPEAREETGPALRIDDDGAHIYWADPVEGCWVAFKRVDCVGEEELPERRLPTPEATEVEETEEYEGI